MTRPTRFIWFPIGVLRLAGAVLHVLSSAVILRWRFARSDVEGGQRLVQDWSRRFLAILGIDAYQIGHLPSAPDHRGGLIVANHISFIDIVLINALAPSCFVSKDDVAGWPIIGPLATMAGTIYLERGSRRAAHRVQEKITEGLRQGRRIAIFPEGTTTDGTAMLPFHGALFQAAIDAQVSVHCLCLRYQEADDPAGQSSPRPAYIGELSLLDCLWQIVSGPRLRATLEWLTSENPPHPDRRHLAHHAHQRIAHALAGKHRRSQHQLVAHAKTPADDKMVSVTLERNGDSWHVHYQLSSADLALPAMDPALAGQRCDDLWQHTCAELFVADAESANYREFNFSPSGQWAAYDFTAYRQRSDQLPAIATPHIRCREHAGVLHLRVTLASGSLPAYRRYLVGLTVVRRANDGQQSHTYWALSHAAAKPDFHQRDSFVLLLD